LIFILGIRARTFLQFFVVFVSFCASKRAKWRIYRKIMSLQHKIHVPQPTPTHLGPSAKLDTCPVLVPGTEKIGGRSLHVYKPQSSQGL
jgi:hypothetical protein